MRIKSYMHNDRWELLSVADPGFPVGGRGPVTGGHGPPTQALFTKNVGENERIGFHGGGVCWAHPLDPPMTFILSKSKND